MNTNVDSNTVNCLDLNIRIVHNRYHYKSMINRKSLTFKLYNIQIFLEMFISTIWLGFSHQNSTDLAVSI